MTLYGLPGSTLVFIISFGKVGQAHAGLKEHPSTKQTKWPDKVTGEAKRLSAPGGKKLTKVKIVHLLPC